MPTTTAWTTFQLQPMVAFTSHSCRTRVHRNRALDRLFKWTQAWTLAGHAMFLSCGRYKNFFLIRVHAMSLRFKKWSENGHNTGPLSTSDLRRETITFCWLLFYHYQREPLLQNFEGNLLNWVIIMQNPIYCLLCTKKGTKAVHGWLHSWQGGSRMNERKMCLSSWLE